MVDNDPVTSAPDVLETAVPDLSAVPLACAGPDPALLRRVIPAMPGQDVPVAAFNSAV